MIQLENVNNVFEESDNKDSKFLNGSLKASIKIAVAILAMIFIFIFILTSSENTDKKQPVYTTVWNESKIQINYQNGYVDTVNINIYESISNIKLENGNFSYIASDIGEGNCNKWIQLSSYVRSYKIIKNVRKSKTY